MKINGKFNFKFVRFIQDLNIPSTVSNTIAFFDKNGGLARNRTGLQGFAVLCVTVPPRGLMEKNPRRSLS